MELWELWKKVQGRVEFKPSLLDTLQDEFALLFEDFPVSVISCVQIYMVFQYVQADYFSLDAHALGDEVWLAIYMWLGFAMLELTSR